MSSQQTNEDSQSYRLFGTTIAGFAKQMFGTAHLGGKQPAKWKPLMQFIIGLLMIVVGSYMVVLDQGKSQVIGASLLSSVAGYWLR